MKREGYQHGMVKTLPIPWDPLRPNGLSPVPTAGLFAKVPTKPTNHSKFTGKCGRAMCRECHVGQASKSKDKVKGAHRLRSPSSTSARRLSGFAASTVLDYYLDDDYYTYGGQEEHDD